MSMDIVTKWLNLAANLGVVAGIIFLILEIQQNNELISSNASFSRFNVERERRNRIIENPDGIAEIAFKNATGQPLTEFESFRLGVFSADSLETLKWQYAEIQAGRLDEDSIDIDAWSVVWNGDNILQAIFNARREGLEPALVEFIEENFLNQ